MVPGWKWTTKIWATCLKGYAFRHHGSHYVALRTPSFKTRDNGTGRIHRVAMQDAGRSTVKSIYLAEIPLWLRANFWPARAGHTLDKLDYRRVIWVIAWRGAAAPPSNNTPSPPRSSILRILIVLRWILGRSLCMQANVPKKNPWNFFRCKKSFNFFFISNFFSYDKNQQSHVFF